MFTGIGSRRSQQGRVVVVDAVVLAATAGGRGATLSKHMTKRRPCLGTVMLNKQTPATVRLGTARLTSASTKKTFGEWFPLQLSKRLWGTVNKSTWITCTIATARTTYISTNGTVFNTGFFSPCTVLLCVDSWTVHIPFSGLSVSNASTAEPRTGCDRLSVFFQRWSSTTSTITPIFPCMVRPAQ